MNISYFFLLVTLSSVIRTQKNLNLGFIFVGTDSENGDLLGFNLSAGIVPIVLERIRNESLLPQYNFTIYYHIDNCVESNSTGSAYELITNDKVDVIFGPTCSANAIRASLVARFYNVPTFIWGLVSTTQFSNIERFSNVYSANPLYFSLALTALDVMKTFNWTRFTFLSVPRSNRRCSVMYQDFISAANYFSYKTTMVYSFESSSPPLDREFDAFINETIIRARVIVSCFDRDEWKRAFLLKMYDRGLNNSEYVHINMEYTSTAFDSDDYDSDNNPIPFYMDMNTPTDGRDDDALKMAKRMLILDTQRDYFKNKEFDQEAIKRVKEWPFYCDACDITGKVALNKYARYLGDSIYNWAILLNKSLTNDSEDVFKNPNILRKHCLETIDGYTGKMTFDSNCIRLPYIQLTGIDGYGKQRAWFNYSFTSINTYERTDSVSPDTFAMTIFENWGKSIPLNEPICGFLHNLCPINFLKVYYKEVIIFGIIIIIIILAIFSGIIWYILKVRKRKEEELNKWKIPMIKLQNYSKNNEINKSVHSIASDHTFNSSKLGAVGRENTDTYSFYLYNGELVVGKKHKVNFYFTKDDSIELVNILSMDHKNINKFFGMCIDGPIPLSIWKFCNRGSLHEILQTDIPNFDEYFMISLANDIFQGLSYIHSSSINFHGMLNSKICFVNDRWQVKISNIPLKHLSANNKISKINLLWRAPEDLRQEFSIGSKEGDIYSFGIILSEIVSKGNFWNLEAREENIEELIYLIKRGDPSSIRPEIIAPPNIEVNPGFIILIKDCWSESPKNRPPLKQIEKLLKAFNSNGPKNLMDHVFRLLEEYALTLKDEVNERTKEIVEEQKKIDLLLQKMLPIEVANNLKLGKTVDPENFDNVTIFFADIVKFTILASKCSPLQVVTLINDLFTLFDNLIESLDVYKVETIGDGYLCVSGLPTRNGNLHAKEIAELALGFLKICHTFVIPHLPREKVTVRIGCNSGPCVSGVVGLSMPRYCLFGDTVNTASRMESNGKPGKIHTTESFTKLLNMIGGYKIEPRGEVIIKGKGVMNTFWLIGRIGENVTYFNEYNEIKNEKKPETVEDVTNVKQGMYREFDKKNNLENNN
uniref:Guanylate cyclase n=1 Tax=Strongyloides papillosus TaxID=174720 RepID=A0A0N5B8W1_STREA